MKIKLFYLIAIFICIFLSFSSCKKKGCHWASVPDTLILEFRQYGSQLPDSILQKVKLSYFDNGTKKYISDLAVASDSTSSNLGLMGTRNIGSISSGSNNKFYIEFQNGWSKDSIYMHYIPPSEKTNCSYKQEPLKFNNQIAPIDTSFHFGSPVYILNIE